jgi:hypothetical protein
MDGLKMKYFVLKPAGDSPYAKASRAAMCVYADEISFEDPKLATDLVAWADGEEKLSSATREGTTPKYRSKYRKKPIEVEAIRWTGNNFLHITKFLGLHGPATGWAWEQAESPEERERLKIFTLNGPVWVPPGDWIIKGVQGEFYPCKPDIFEQTYEPVG